MNAKNKPLAIVGGAGAGLGTSVATAFAKAGYQVVGLNRSLVPTAPEQIDFRQVDFTDQAALKQCMHEVVSAYGSPAVYVHNPAELVIGSFADTTAEQYEAVWRSMAFSAFVVMQEVVPLMVKAGQGSIIVSGATASIKGGGRFSAFASAKFALRGLTQSIAREYQSSGIHAVHVLLDGIIDTEQSKELHGVDPAQMMQASDIAEQYVQLAMQPQSTWTQELDLRPMSENF